MPDEADEEPMSDAYVEKIVEEATAATPDAPVDFRLAAVHYDPTAQLRILDFIETNDAPVPDAPVEQPSADARRLARAFGAKG
jgi:hypothetical protein